MEYICLNNSTDWEPFVIHMTHWAAAGQTSRRSEVRGHAFRALQRSLSMLLMLCAPPNGPDTTSSRYAPEPSICVLEYEPWSRSLRLRPEDEVLGRCTSESSGSSIWDLYEKRILGSELERNQGVRYTQKNSRHLVYPWHGFPSHPYMHDPAFKKCL